LDCAARPAATTVALAISVTDAFGTCHDLSHTQTPLAYVLAATSTTSDGASPHCAVHSHRQRPGYDTPYPSFSSLYSGSGRQRVEFMTMAGARASSRCERFKEAPPDDARQPRYPAIRHHHRFPASSIPSRIRPFVCFLSR